MVPESEKTSKKNPCAAASATDSVITASIVQSSSVIRLTPSARVDDRPAHTFHASYVRCQGEAREQVAACSSGSIPDNHGQTVYRKKTGHHRACSSPPAKNAMNPESALHRQAQSRHQSRRTRTSYRR